MESWDKILTSPPDNSTRLQPGFGPSIEHGWRSTELDTEMAYLMGRACRLQKEAVDVENPAKGTFYQEDGSRNEGERGLLQSLSDKDRDTRRHHMGMPRDYP
ncbi:hypothetical protein R1flu_013662 [Riccia fluitans]|uniref:Uncharacterized protein n=1 Tax=Riccia fluitans TaxID=41844 RepID=A0ABD1YDV7_9MARC